MKKRKPERINLSSRFSHLTLHRAPTFEEAFRGVLKFYTSRSNRLVGVAIKTRICTVDEDGKKMAACTRVEYTMDQNSHEFDFVIIGKTAYTDANERIISIRQVMKQMSRKLCEWLMVLPMMSFVRYVHIVVTIP